MDKIQTKTCYTTKARNGSQHDLTIQRMVKDGRLDKHENMVVLTVEEFKKLAGNIFEAGARHEYAVEHFFEPTDPDKNEYIKTILP